MTRFVYLNYWDGHGWSNAWVNPDRVLYVAESSPEDEDGRSVIHFGNEEEMLVAYEADSAAKYLAHDANVGEETDE